MNLRALRNILVTFAACHPEVGYAQGMNDIAGRFLSVLGAEVRTVTTLPGAFCPCSEPRFVSL